MKIGKKQDALSLLEEGLRLTPQERALRQPYKRTGGQNRHLAPFAATDAATAGIVRQWLTLAAALASSIHRAGIDGVGMQRSIPAPPP